MGTSHGSPVVHGQGRSALIMLLAPSGARLDSTQVAQRKRRLWKWLTFWSCFFGYAVCYFTRQSLSYTAPALKLAMGWNGLGQLGQLSSVYPLAYGSSRFLGGLLSDRLSPKQVFALGLAICGSLNIAFGLSSSMPLFIGFWLLNGCFQGLAAPAIVKMIANWFTPAERGFWWSVWHASINVGGFLIPFISGSLAEAYGWRFGMLGPGTIALVTAAACFLLMRDAPECSDVVQERKPESDLTQDTADEENVSLREGLLARPEQWALGVAYLLNYVCRQGLAVWGIFYLLHAAAASGETLSVAGAAALFSGFELGGLLGNLSAGALSDLLLRRMRPGESEPGQRVKVVAAYFCGSLLLLASLARCPSSLPWLQYLLMAGLGHFLCGCQLLLPLIAAEVAPKNLLATSNGLIGFVGYFGAVFAGLPLSFIVQRLGWPCYFTVLMTAAACGAVLSVTLRGVHGWRQQQHHNAEKAVI